jgi:hypothetical protein
MDPQQKDKYVMFFYCAGSTNARNFGRNKVDKRVGFAVVIDFSILQSL